MTHEVPSATKAEDPEGSSFEGSALESTKGVEESSPGASSADPSPSSSTWSEFLSSASEQAIKSRFSREGSSLVASYGNLAEQYSVLALLEPADSIDKYELDKIYSALQSKNSGRSKDVLLVLLSRGGSIEPAYQISKLCKLYSRTKFVVVVPREAKSAATLIALGADEIHMGTLGQLGPIDPQLDGLPALGVAKALETIARLAERFPGSSELFARYLRLALTVEQIGYCDRISESAVQYAERLLATKPALRARAGSIARELVHDYKHHGFVIDLEEARQHLGEEWVLTATPELDFAEELYDLFDTVNLFLGVYRKKRIAVFGELEDGVLMFDVKR